MEMRMPRLQHLLTMAMPDLTKDAIFDSAYLKLRRSNFPWMVMSAGRFPLLFLELMGLAQAALWRWITRRRRTRRSRSLSALLSCQGLGQRR